MILQSVALGVAVCDADHKVREEGGNNRGARIRAYLDNADIGVPAPWCAAFVQYCADVAARSLGVLNPLDDVKLEAYVQSYADHFRNGNVVTPELARPGDLVFFSFGGERWDHIGFVAQRPIDGTFWSVEGNTSDASQRDGDGVVLKPRTLTTGRREPMFVRWGAVPELDLLA